MLTRFSQSLLRPGGGCAQPFCRAFGKKKPFCRMGGLVLLQNEWLRPHRGNWKGDVDLIFAGLCQRDVFGRKIRGYNLT